ncbi:ABC transporter G family member 10 [Cucumis melo var. makuwa]|uniref:ABC transporter G family member 10 n=1 Tax=Cucumis melo var. makuwa TaxID=1194695 RepID=A0A5A7VBQ4_CUCMM|nr:ABC transporter G family member 10 [Cucumis melo var. makuwa]
MELPMKRPISGDQRSHYRIEARNLCYKISESFDGLNWVCGGGGGSSKRGPKFILKNVNCEARAGEITAIAGPSGAGKTTLLEILGGNIPLKKISGQVLVNDQHMLEKMFPRISGYVTQDDALFPFLTVEESLMYSALLRLAGGRKEAESRVRRLMKDLGLEQVAGSRVGGGSNRGISGGERRRVSIGVELVHDPAVIFIDEPTSGLDSVSALHVMSVLRRMVISQGKTVLLTIHQPGFRILELFDRLILLSSGVVMHNGSLDHLEEMLKLANHQIPHHVNVLEFAIDVVDSLAMHTSETFNRLHYLQNRVENQTIRVPRLDKDEEPISYQNSRSKEVVILGQRFFKNTFRTKQLFATRVIQALVAGVVLGTIFFKTGNNNGRTALQTRLGFFAFSLTFLLSSTTEGLPIFLRERMILMRETSRGAYRVSSYVLANTLIFLPFLLMVSLLFAASVYWLVGFKNEVSGFFYFSLVVWMVVLMSNSFVACFSALVPNFITGNSVIAGLMGSFFLFSGYFISKKNIPNYWIFVHYLSLFKYPFECFLINEYGGEQGKGRCIESKEGVCTTYGEMFLRQQGLKESQKWTNLAVMLGFIVGYRILSFVILWYRCNKIRS